MTGCRLTADSTTRQSADPRADPRADSLRVAVAYSGGRDSTALLHATLVEAGRCGMRVLALHVHHGLSAQADGWLAHCEAQCRAWADAQGLPIEFDSRRLAGHPLAGQSVEAWARAARYQALGEMAQAHGVSLVLLAHHRRDQAETFLLQALRGAGIAGLSGMPPIASRRGLTWARPWLHKSRDEIEAYVARHSLDFVEDDSNADPRFARNRLRLQVWPALAGAFPDAEPTIARAADWAAEAESALTELAAIDLAELANGDALQVPPWLGLSPARRSLALRTWLTQRAGVAVDANLVRRLMLELPTARGGSRWQVVGDELRLHRGSLRWRRNLPAAASAPPESNLCIRRAGIYRLPGWGGRLQVRRVPAGGVPLAWLARIELRSREGGERFQAGPDRPPRSLKKQYQMAGIAAWDRLGPLLYSGGLLVFAPGLGLDARVVGISGQAAVSLDWQQALSTDNGPPDAAA